MSTILTGNDPSATRLVEAIAGSSGSLLGPSTTSSDLPLLSILDPILGDDASPAAATQDGVPLANNVGIDQVSDLVQSVTHLLDGQDAAAAVTTAAAQPAATTAATEPSPLDLAGDGAVTQPVLDAANSAIKQVHYTLEVLSHDTGTSNAIHGVTSLGETIGLGEIGAAPQPDGHSNLVTDVLNAPGDLLNGDLTGVISNVGHDLTDIVNGAANLVDTILLGTGDTTNRVATNDPTNPIPELIQAIGHDLQSLPILSVNNGDGSGSGGGGLLGGSGGGLLDGLVGDLSHSSSNHLADVNVGPEQDQGGLILNLLAAPETGPHHAVDVNAVDVGSTGPHLADLGVLTGGDNGLGIPLLGGSGTDGLVGNLLDLGGSHPASSPTSTPPATGPIAETGNLDLGGILSGDHGILNLHGVHLI